jgi:hypothetical protein
MAINKNDMPNSLPRLLRPLFTLCVLLLSACAHNDAKRWAGDYEAGIRKLQLLPTGEFSYDGGGCFPAHSDSDVGFSDDFAGRYRVDGRWLVLEPANLGYIDGCSGITLKLYAGEHDDRRFLLDEKYLHRIAHDLRRGAAFDRFWPWHVAGEPGEFSAMALKKLPPPYAALASMPPPSGRVVAIDSVQQRTRYGSAGRVDGEEMFAMLTIDFGRRHGAFAGMPVCLSGGSRRYWLDAVDEDSSTLRWAWSTSGEGAPVVGMSFESTCRAGEP